MQAQHHIQASESRHTCMLDEDGGVIDDLIVYYFDETRFRLVVNAATREKDLAWIGRQAEQVKRRSANQRCRCRDRRESIHRFLR